MTEVVANDLVLLGGRGEVVAVATTPQFARIVVLVLAAATTSTRARRSRSTVPAGSSRSRMRYSVLRERIGAPDACKPNLRSLPRRCASG